MRGIILFLSLACFVFPGKVSWSQGTYSHILPQEVCDKISKSNKVSVIHFWIPNCENAKEVVTRFRDLAEKYSDEVDFYFIGITNIDSLVINLIDQVGYKGHLYIADTSVDADINKRIQHFCLDLCEQLKLKDNREFITMFLDKTDKVRYMGDMVRIKEDKLRKIM